MDLEILIPITAIVMIFGIPIAGILTNHQRKMAEIMRQNQPSQTDPYLANQILALRQEVKELKEIVHQQVLTLEGRTMTPPIPTSTEDVIQRL